MQDQRPLADWSLQTLWQLIQDAKKHLDNRKKWEPFIRHCLKLIESDYIKYCRDADQEALERAFDIVSDDDMSDSDDDDNDVESEYDSDEDDIPLSMLHKF